MPPEFATLADETFPDGRTFQTVARIGATGDVACPSGVSVGDVFIGGGFQPRAAILRPPVADTGE